jgi:hypothetical protein
MDFDLQKGLEAAPHSRMLRPPFDSWAAGENRAVRGIKARKQQFPRQDFFGNFGIGVDGGNAQVLAGNLSPLGRLFEIYFVRLIGTPNQNSRDAGSGRHHS